MAETLSSESVARGETDNSLAPGDYTPNFEWMKEHIGDVLVQGIAETLLLRPEDPIEYLGQWLAQHARNLELEKKLLNERTVIQAEVDEKKRVIEEKKRHALVKLEREQRRKHAHQRAQDEVKAKAEAEQRAKELDLIRAERTENKPPPLFGIPETIVEVPSISNVQPEASSN